MNDSHDKIVIFEGDPVARGSLEEALRSANFDVGAVWESVEAIQALSKPGTAVVLLGIDIGQQMVREILAGVRGSAVGGGIRVILLTGPSPIDRAEAIDLGADDAVSRPWNPTEIISRVRAQLRGRKSEMDLRDKMRIAEEGQQIAHTAFEALAVTEKMATEATSVGRNLKIGVASAFVVLAVMFGVYLLFVRSAQHQTKSMSAVIARLDGNLMSQQNLIARARQLRQQGTLSPDPAAKDQLQKQAQDLQAKMQTANSGDVAALQKELFETNARLKQLENQGDAAENLIASSVQSVCLLHVAVAFRDKDSGRRLRYAGLGQNGEPLRDSDGNPILTLDGRGPEVKTDVFGTGFLAGPNGRVITNHHVAEPWWKDEQIGNLVLQGFQPEISTIRAYFPGDARAFHGEIQQISPDIDLATMRFDLQDLRRSSLTIDATKTAAVAGEPIVLMGYATGLDAILARADETTAQNIMDSSSGDVPQILDELARRNLIRPLITQGHIGDILPDKIVFDAQTTSGGSGGPLFNQQGKVIGVTYAVLRGFGGSNFGIPIKFSEPLLTH